MARVRDPSYRCRVIQVLADCRNKAPRVEISSARAGADQALTFVLSWYESIDLRALQSLRSDSKWTSDPTLIQSRKEAASFMATYAQTQSLTPGPVYSDDEEDDVEEDEDDDEEEEADEGDRD